MNQLHTAFWVAVVFFVFAVLASGEGNFEKAVAVSAFVFFGTWAWLSSIKKGTL